jgi:hypothetical protein
MNFCVYQDSGAEVHGYIVPDGYSKKARVLVRLDGEQTAATIDCFVFIEGARTQGLHETGNVGFVLSEDNVPGISCARQLELVDPDSTLVFYRRAQPGQYIPRKVFRLETSYVPHTELDLCLNPYFQFYAHRVEHYGFQTVRNMLEILHQPSVYVSGRILLKNFQIYLDYNTDTKIIGLRDPFYELALRLLVFSRAKTHRMDFIAPRDLSLFKQAIDHFDSIPLHDDDAITRAVRSAKKDTLAALASPFVQQLVADNPSEIPTLNDVSQALDVLSQFDIFDSGGDPRSLPQHIAEFLGLPSGLVRMRPQMASAHQLAHRLRKIGRLQELLEADLILYHFVAKAEARAEPEGRSPLSEQNDQ